jgi:cytidylate kinase
MIAAGEAVVVVGFDPEDGPTAERFRQHFGIDWSDPLHYDLVINFDRVTPREAHEIAVTLVRCREPSPKE